MKPARYIAGLLCIFGLCFCLSAQAQISVQYIITGIENPVQKNVLDQLKIAQQNLTKKLTKKQARKLFEESENVVKQAIQPYGYFKPIISAHIVREGEKWTFHYHVATGPVIHIQEIDLQITGPGKNDKLFNKVVEHFPLKYGDAFNAEEYNKAKRKLLDAAEERGYLSAKYKKANVIVQMVDYYCKIVLHLETGPKYYFGSVKFNKTPLSHSFLSRYIEFNSKQSVSFSKLLKLQKNLTGSDYFKSVTITPQLKKAKNHHVPINVNLKMRKKKSYRFGFGYGTSSGLRATIGFTNRWINKQGHRFNILTTFSTVEYGLGAQYLIPGTRPAYEHYAINASIAKQVPRRGSSINKLLGVGQIKNYLRWQRNLSINIEHNKYHYNKHDPYRTAKLFYPKLIFTYVRQDHVENPSDASTLSIYLLGTHTSVISSVSLLKGEIDAGWMYSLTHNNRIVLTGEYGYVLISNLNKLPMSKAFYTGGINSVRGYRYLGLGPGRYLLTGQAEYRYRVYKDWFAAVFYDIGNAFDTFGTMEALRQRLVRGTGVGVVWQTKMGALKAYVSRALSRNGKPWRFDFSFGPNL